MIEAGWVVRISHAAQEPEATEVLEFVLAGASLELQLTVVFSGQGQSHLSGDSARRWRQLTDFGMARLCCEDPGTGDMDAALPVDTLAQAEIESLVRTARGVIEL